MTTAPIITLTTDFGLRDPFVGIMKGVILGICREAQLVDLTHELAAHDVREGMLALESSWRFFPAGSVHLAVIDPGVGSRRRALALRAGGHCFVGPDNGLFTFALASENWSAVSLETEAYRLPQVSRTFHGRDIFAPAAGHLACGVPLDRLGPELRDPARIPMPGCRCEGEDLVGEVIASDRFGNLITSITALRLDEIAPRGEVVVEIAGRQLARMAASYAEGPAGVPALILGSAGRLEIFVKEGSARAVLDAGPGTPVRVRRVPAP